MIKEVHIEYCFDETGSKIIYYGNGKIALFYCTDRATDTEVMKSEATWIYVIVKMIHDIDKQQVNFLIDLHNTHSIQVSKELMEFYHDIMQAGMGSIKKISVVGDVFQCSILRILSATIPQYQNNIHFFLNYQKAKSWLKWV